MGWNEFGFLVPQQIGECGDDCGCIQVCPFNPFPKDEVKTEDELANIFLNNARYNHPKVGKFERIYAGYSNAFRETSSSGGMATFIFMKIFEAKVADAILVVAEKEGFYEYQLLRPDDLMKSSKTKYYPVTLDTVFKHIDQYEGKVAVVGVACFIKAIRLAQHTTPMLRTKITFLVGIICGGLKSAFFTDYLASRVGFEENSYKDPNYRIKNPKSTASDYSFGCTSIAEPAVSNEIKMKLVGDMWGSGLFKANACDFCEDVTTELADISLGDAWISPYANDGKGTSVIVTRSPVGERLIQDGINKQELTLEDLGVERLIKSQKGSFNHRHKGLLYRITKRKEAGLLVPPKRQRNLKPVNFLFTRVQRARMRTRESSLRLWKELQNAGAFDRAMSGNFKRLKDATRLYHFFRKLKMKLRL